MKILHTVEYYTPSVGGAQEVVRQISERLARRGHQVTVATTTHPKRAEQWINGVKVEEFEIFGNPVNGFQGEIDRYQQFLLDGDFDIMMNYAAQEWTMDLVFPVLDRIPYRKVMIPCGFSKLFDPAYQTYYEKMPHIMRGYDHLVFHADDYRDTNFARQHGIANFTIIPNGASEIEFGVEDTSFRERYRIPADIPLLLTIGSHTAAKGHRLCLEAFGRLQTDRAILMMIGNIPDSVGQRKKFLQELYEQARNLNIVRLGKMLIRAILGGVEPGCLPDDRIYSKWINLSNRGKKRVILADPPRTDVIAALQAADLFIFGSNVEYSPLVLYEAIASHTPFVSLACGNAAEIATWSGGGIIAPTIQQGHGNVDGDPNAFASVIDQLIVDAEQRKTLAHNGYNAWQTQFTWDALVSQYETLYLSLIDTERNQA